VYFIIRIHMSAITVCGEIEWVLMLVDSSQDRNL
jgi:hypothetical protein